MSKVCRCALAVVNGSGIYTWQSASGPALNVAASRSNLLLSWAVPSPDFVLQQNSDLAITNWTDLSVTPGLNLTNLQNQAILSRSPGNRFYRLKH